MFALVLLQGVGITHQAYITCMPARVGAIPERRQGRRRTPGDVWDAPSAGACSPAEPGVLIETRRRRLSHPRLVFFSGHRSGDPSGPKEHARAADGVAAGVVPDLQVSPRTASIIGVISTNVTEPHPDSEDRNVSGERDHVGV